MNDVTGAIVEIAPWYDNWMRGATIWRVISIKDGLAKLAFLPHLCGRHSRYRKMRMAAPVADLTVRGTHGR